MFGNKDLYYKFLYCTEIFLQYKNLIGNLINDTNEA